MSLTQSIQTQWDIGQSIFTLKDRIVELIRAGSEDDVQPQAILAMEGLGAGIIVHNDRIGEGKLALKGGESYKLEKLLLLIGFTGGGVARLMRDSTPCIASFLLIVACKTCFTDDETGAILYEMMVLRNVLRTVPVFKEQICQYVCAISGYGYSILPIDNFNRVATVVQESLRYGEIAHGALTRLFDRLDAKAVAEILIRTFEALQNEDVTRVTLEGDRTGVWLISVFLWLRPDDTEVILHNRRMFGESGSRLSIALDSKGLYPDNWVFNAWHLEKNISAVVVQAEQTPFTMHRTDCLSHIPLGSAKSYLAVQYELSPEGLEAVGRVAAALVDIVFECGEYREYSTNHSSPGTSKPYKRVLFRDICQEAFISKHHTIIGLFGWKLEDKFVESGRAAIVDTFKAWLHTAKPDDILKDAGGDVIKATTTVLHQLKDQYFQDHQRRLLDSERSEELKHFHPSLHVAVEALFFSVCDTFPSARPFRLLTHLSLHRNAMVFWQLLFHNLPNANDQIDGYRIEAIKAMLPGTPTVGGTDLAVESNGCVAFASPLLQITTNRRACYAISVVPGALRWGDHEAPFKQLVDIEALEFPPYVALFELGGAVEIFRGAEYLGLEAQGDLFGAGVQMLVSPSGKTLKLASYINPMGAVTSPSEHTGALIEVSWLASIRALVFAEHVSGHSITALGEKSLAEAWKERNILANIQWRGAGAAIREPHGAGHITRTSSNESLRFFEAGRWKINLIVRHTAPLIQCLKVAIDLDDRNPWVIIG